MKHNLQPVASTAKTLPSNEPSEQALSEDWLRDFYKECGREVTLAYTTLNQMKNWAIVVDAAIITAVGAIGRSAAGRTDQISPGLALFIGASIALVFTIRYFVRAILCYINLIRWNTLQSAVTQAMLVAKDGGVPSPDAMDELRRKIVLHYHGWRSPIDRSRQVLANLKLGFALLLGLPLVVFIWGTVEFGASPLGAAAIVFVVGSLFIEGNDFWGSSLFDDAQAAERRRARRGDAPQVFPLPHTSASYLIQWLIVLLLSGAAATWPLVLSVLQLVCAVMWLSYTAAPPMAPLMIMLYLWVKSQ